MLYMASNNLINMLYIVIGFFNATAPSSLAFNTCGYFIIIILYESGELLPLLHKGGYFTIIILYDLTHDTVPIFI